MICETAFCDTAFSDSFSAPRAAPNAAVTGLGRAGASCRPSRARPIRMLVALAWLTVGCGTTSNNDLSGNSALRPASTIGVSVKASSPNVLGGERIELQAAASGAEGLTYQWQQTRPRTPVGTFTSADKATTGYMAPPFTIRTRVALACTVTGPEGSKTSEVIVVVDPLIEDEDAGESADVPFQAASSLTNVRSGSQVMLSIAGARNFSNFAWRQVGPTNHNGTFDDATVAQAAFRAPAVAASETFVLQVSATDRNGATQTSTVSLVVEPATYKDDVLPIWEAHCVGCHNPNKTRANFDMTNSEHYFQDNFRPNCGAGKRVVAGDVGASSLVRRLKNTCAEGGARMPPKDDLFDRQPELLERVESWIASGAVF